MPPLPAVPGVCKILTAGNLYDGEWLNIWHLAYTGDAPDTGTLVSYLSTYWMPLWDTWFGDDASTESTTSSHIMIDLSSDLGAEGSVSDSQAGARTGDVAPVSSAVMGSMEIDRRYRGGHPRKYLPLGTAGTYKSASSKFWDPGFVSAVQGHGETFIAAVAGKTVGSTNFGGLVNVSYVSAGARRVTPVVDAIVGITIRDRICSQRRRLGKIGG